MNRLETVAEEIRQDLSRVVLPRLKARYSGLDYSIEGAGKEQAESMRDVQEGFLLALFLSILLLPPLVSSAGQRRTCLSLVDETMGRCSL